MQPSLPPTQLREYYDALHALKEQEQTALAELHADQPERLIARFANSVEAVAAYPALTEPFHGPRSEAWMDKAGEPVTSTTTFVANMAAAVSHKVTGAPELDFDYLDREVFPLRSTTIGVGERSVRRSVDVLLRDKDGFPIVGELKVAGDSATYYALVQSLAYAAELSSASQLRRLGAHYGLRIAEGDPALSIYLLAYAAPERGLYRKRSFAATEAITAKLMADHRVGRVIRRIAYLEASSAADGSLVFKRFF